MAVTRKPSASHAQPDIDELINRGGTAPGQGRERDATESESVAVIVRIPAKILADIDRSVKARQIRTPRHTWLLEAIVEKLGREHEAVLKDIK
jgi:hypothetical protein